MRTREQTYSTLIGLHVNAGSLLTDQRLDEYARGHPTIIFRPRFEHESRSTEARNWRAVPILNEC